MLNATPHKVPIRVTRLDARLAQPAICIALWCSSLAAHATWPVIELPDQAAAFAVGDDMVANGVPMRVKGFVSQQSAQEVQAWFRRRWGQPLVESVVGSKRILGRAQEGYYLTAQIEPLANNAGSKGLIAVSDLKKAGEARQRYLDDTHRWVQRWPSGSTIISYVSSNDVGKAASHVVLVNGHSESLNRDAVKDLLRQEGYFFEHGASTREATTLFFRANGKEAIATVHKDEFGRTAIVLNTVTQLERIK